MSLSCSCEYDHDFEPGDWHYIAHGREIDFEQLRTAKRKRCCSCNDLIDIGSLCLVHIRRRYPYNDIESKIEHGCDLEDAMCDEPSLKMADHYHCERCGEIWLNLWDLGYDCLAPNENMADALAEYHELSGFKQAG